VKYFDVHLHLPSPDTKGLDAFLRHLDGEPHMMGGNLILNTPKEVDFVSKNLAKIPEIINLIPYYLPETQFPEEIQVSNWFKIHPRLRRFTARNIPEILDSLIALPIKPRGLIVDCYPWGTDLEYNINLPLVINLAKAFPDIYVLVAHGGGYESWEFRAHTGSFKNVIYDFSATLSFYQGSDILKPFQRYLKWSKDRNVFGSDWPIANCAEQLAECIRLAQEVGISETELESIFMSNAKRIWGKELKMKDIPRSNPGGC
jgi:hypothetical protein